MAGNYSVTATLDDKISPALGKIQNQLNTTTSAFAGLKTALAGIAFGALIKDALAYADAVADLSDATGIAVQNILGFQKAVQGAGGSVEGAQKGILKLVNGIGDAANGSADMQDAFAQVGVTLKDLATLSEQDILRKTVAGLGKINDVGQQSILKTQLLGKEFRNVSAAKLDETLDKATAASIKYADAVQKAADAQDVFDRAASASKMAIIDLISPLTSLANSIPTDKWDQFVSAITKMTALAALTLALAGLVAGFSALTATATGALAVLAALAGNFLIIVAVASALTTIFVTLNELLKYSFDIDLIEKFKNGIGSLIDKVKEYYNALAGKPKFLDEAEVNRENKLLKQRQDALQKQQEELRKVADATKKLRMEMQAITDDFHKQNIAMANQIGLENELIGKTLEYQDARKAEEEIIKRSQDAIDKLTAAKEKLTDAEKRAGMGGVIDAQISNIKKLADADMELAKRQQKNLQDTIIKQKLLEFGTKNRIDMEDKLMSIQDDIATSTMTEIEKKYYDIEKAANASALAAIRAEEARLGRRLDENEAKKYYEEAAKWTRILTEEQKRANAQSRTFSSGWQKAFKEYADNATNAARAAERIFAKAMSGMEDLIVDFAKTGEFQWKNFVSMMLEELLRSQIQQTFAGIMSSMSSGGGLLGSLFGGGAGGGQAVGASPSNPMYVIDISGGAAGGAGGATGGGIFANMGKPAAGAEGGGLFGSIGKAAGSAWEGIKSVGSSIGDAIGGLFGGGPEQLSGPEDSGGGFFSGISDLFDGFFANGGQIGAGKFGVVGEAGPELVSGPATVTPMGGGQNVTYNINAVDAQSFKAMIAQDPSFIHAVAMQGAKGVPARR